MRYHDRGTRGRRILKIMALVTAPILLPLGGSLLFLLFTGGGGRPQDALPPRADVTFVSPRPMDLLVAVDGSPAVKAARQNGMIPEQSFAPHGYGRYIKCPCTPDMLEHTQTRKEKFEDIIEYHCSCCGNTVTKVEERIIDESQMT